MNIEKRMAEFEKVANKESSNDVKGRMSDFQKVEKCKQNKDTDKASTLPFGIKRYRTCPICDEMMEIDEIKKNGVIYYCKTCNKYINMDIEV